jgi:transposase
MRSSRDNVILASSALALILAIPGTYAARRTTTAPARRRMRSDIAEGLRWLWITNPENLTADQRQELQELKVLLPELGRLHDLRESLRSLFEDQRIRRPETAVEKFREWIAEARRTSLKALETFCRTLENWSEEIANYFVSRSSNGRTEGFNHGLRAILWRAFGLRNFEHFRLRVLHLFGEPETQEST